MALCVCPMVVEEQALSPGSNDWSIPMEIGRSGAEMLYNTELSWLMIHQRPWKDQ